MSKPRVGGMHGMLRCAHRRSIVLVALTAGLLSGLAAKAEIVDLNPSQDNTLYESEAGDLSNGQGSYLFSGRTRDGVLRRALLHFDIASNIPAGSTINSVTLTLEVSRVKNVTATVSLHRVVTAWGEGTSDAPDEEGEGAPATTGDATWLHTFYASDFWASEGGDFDDGVSASTTVGDLGTYTWSSSNMVLDVGGWLLDPGSNHGWIVIGDETANRSAKRFNSSENPQTSSRPVLTVDFTPPPETGGCCFSDGGCSLLDANQCAAQGGAYEGDETSCDPNPCPQPTGACCAGDGSCIEQTAAECTTAGGSYQGDGSDCGSVECPVLVGACCLPGDPGSCEELSASACAAGLGFFQGENTDCQVDLCPFVDRLPRPAVAQPVSGSPGGAATYELAMTEFEQQLHRDLSPTIVWGYAGSFPGPTIEAGRDQSVTVHWINDLRDDMGELRSEHILPVDTCPHGADDSSPRTVVHLHGGHVPMEYDGYPEATFLPGEEAVYIYANNQLPATLWYHDHALGITRLNVYMGLAGFYLLRDAFEESLGLPAGENEIPLAIQDRSFHPDGSFAYPALWQGNFFADYVLVNGKVWPYLEVKQGKYRFRVLNGSNARTYTLALSDGATFFQIGSEGGLLEAPEQITEITLTPGERADLVMDFEGYEAGEEVLLVNSAPAPFPGTPGVGVIPDVMKFVVGSETGHVAPLPVSLRSLEVLDEGDAVEHRQFELTREQTAPCGGSWWLINGLGWDDVTEYPLLDTTEVWSFVNLTGVVHPMHMHLVMFQLLDRQDFELVEGEVVPVGSPIPPEPGEAGWKDTVQALPNQITRVIARFDDYTGLFSYHCHILEHEDHEMMRQFEVVAPGTIVVEKQTRPDARPESFTFTGDAAGTLEDGGQIVVSGLAPGSYTSSEQLPANWGLLAIDCDDGNSSGNTETATATFQLQAGKTVTCIFTDCILDLVLSGETVDTPTTYEACDTITASSDFTVASDTVFRAANLIVLGDGFSVTGDASFTAEIAPDLQLGTVHSFPSGNE